MHQLVPRFVLEKHAAGEQNGRFSGVALFVDISGFTALTAQLQKHGTAGAETLATILGAVFEPLITAVYAHGGFVSGFAGDAFTAIFPNVDSQSTLYALATAQQIREHVAQHASYDTPFGTFQFSLRTSIALGDIEWAIWQTTQPLPQGQTATFTFGGNTIDAAIQGEALAQANELVVTRSFLQALTDTVVSAPEQMATSVDRGSTYWHLHQMPANLPPQQPIDNSEDSSLSVASEFYSTDLLTQPLQGEFRRVLSLFLSLPSLPNATEDDPFLTVFFRLLQQYGGYLGRFGRFGSAQPGGTFLLFWGAPTSHENDVERVLNFVLDLQVQTAVSFKAGITHQIAYAGFVGAPLREEYTCYGLSVNLAARLMTSAPWGSIWIDEAVAQRAEGQYQVIELEKRPFKGFANPLPVYQLQRRRTLTSDPIFRGTMVGRRQEMAQLAASLLPLENGRFGGVVTVSGEAGIGKSRLLHDSLNQANQLANGKLLLCQTDEILREPLNPFRYFLRRYFAQAPTATTTENEAQFRTILKQLVADTPDPSLQAELERTRSFLGALVDLHWPESLYERSEPKLRQENSFAALKNLIKAESLRQPVVLQIEDVHWLDNSSAQFLVMLTRNVADFPFVVWTTTRAAQLDVSLGEEVAQQTITLHSLGEIETAQLAAGLLHAPASPDLIRFLLARTDGNPFFVEQLVIYLREQGHLQSVAEGVGLKTAVSTLPSDLQAILIARIDQLTQEVRQVVQTAAVLGREFEVQILSQMLVHEATLPEKVDEAQAANIWSALSELRYLFKHALLRDAAYDMQLQAQRKQLHQIAAEAIIERHADMLPLYYADLAHHYGQAGVRHSEAHYARLAGEAAAAQFANAEALGYLNRALELTDEGDDNGRFALLSARVEIYDLLGKREEQAQDLDQLFQLASRLTAVEQATVKLKQASYAQIISDYPTAIQYARQAVKLAQQSQSSETIASTQAIWGQALQQQGDYLSAQTQYQAGIAVSNNVPSTALATNLKGLGIVMAIQGELVQARRHFEQAQQISQAINDQVGVSANLNNLGAVAANLADYATAQTYYEQSVAIKEEIGDRRGLGISYNNLGVVAADLHQYANARVYYEKGLAIQQEIGDQWSISYSHGNLGGIYTELGDYLRARHHLEQALAISKEIGDQRGLSIHLDTLGVVAHHLAAYDEAEKYFQQALAIYQETGNQRAIGICLNELGALAYDADNIAQAQTYYEEARVIHQTTAQEQHLAETRSGLMRIAQANDELEKMANYLASILAHLAENPTLDGVNNPWRTFFDTWSGLKAINHPQANDVLRMAYRQWQKIADTLPDDEAQRLFWESNR
ncbi:MAG: tetratricopeptide repeat protein, partial [Chloroflexota bacterium]